MLMTLESIITRMQPRVQREGGSEGVREGGREGERGILITAVP